MKTIALTAMVLHFALLLPAYSQTAQRFDGTWVGTETATSQRTSWDSNAPKPQPVTSQATLTISQGGKSVNKDGGTCYGQWEHVFWANNAINFSSHNCKIKLTLSPNGKILTESGSIALSPAHWGRSDAPAGEGNYQLFGTFHRQ